MYEKRMQPLKQFVSFKYYIVLVNKRQFNGSFTTTSSNNHIRSVLKRNLIISLEGQDRQGIQFMWNTTRHWRRLYLEIGRACLQRLNISGPEALYDSVVGWITFLTKRESASSYTHSSIKSNWSEDPISHVELREVHNHFSALAMSWSGPILIHLFSSEWNFYLSNRVYL